MEASKGFLWVLLSPSVGNQRVKRFLMFPRIVSLTYVRPRELQADFWVGGTRDVEEVVQAGAAEAVVVMDDIGTVRCCGAVDDSENIISNSLVWSAIRLQK